MNRKDPSAYTFAYFTRFTRSTRVKRNLKNICEMAFNFKDQPLDQNAAAEFLRMPQYEAVAETCKKGNKCEPVNIVNAHNMLFPEQKGKPGYKLAELTQLFTVGKSLQACCGDVSCTLEDPAKKTTPSVGTESDS